VLDEGQGEMDAVRGFAVDARSLRITGASEDARARVRIDGGRRVLVAAVRGSLRVSNGSGLVVPRLASGEALDLEPQTAGAPAATQVSGWLLGKAGKFILVDRTTNVIIELRGADLAAQVGNRVEITGRAETVKTEVPEASQVIAVAGLKMVAKGGC